MKRSRLLAAVTALIAAGGVATLGPVDRGDGSPGPARQAVATSPQELSDQIAANDTALRQAIDAWRATGDPPAADAPPEVMTPALYLQRTTRFLAKRSNLAESTISLLPAALASEVGELTAAARKLRKLSGNTASRKVKTGAPPSLAELLGHYDAAERRYAIGAHYLAAVHLVETKFGRVKSNSVAGAKGPMQFIPSTWRIYGHGGDIQDPHDAILAAADLLRSNGAPGNYRRALYAYNQSQLYVDAVQRFAGVIARNPYALYYLYCWGP